MTDFTGRFFLVAIVCLAAGMVGCRKPPTQVNQTGEPGLIPSLPASSETTAITPLPAASQAVATAVVQPGNSEIPTDLLEGLVVAFSVKGELLVWSGEIANLIKTQGAAYNPRLSADGELIAFLRPVNNYQIELWVINSDGSHERRLAGAAELEPIGGTDRDPNALAIVPHRYEWLPGSHILAFNSEYVYQGPGTVLLDDFNLVDADSGGLTYLFLKGWGGEFYLSPLGDQVAITTPGEVILANLDGSGWRSVFSYPPVITYSDYRFYAEPAWSPDGSSLMIALPPEDPLADPAMPSRLVRLDAASSSSSEIGQVFSLPFFDAPVHFSPDQDRLAFLAQPGQPEDIMRTLNLASIDGTDSQMYYQAEMLQFLGWNEAGSRFSLSAGEDQVLYVGAPEVNPEMLQPTLPGIIKVSWIDSDRFLYLQGIGEMYSLGLADIQGQAIVIASQVNARLEFDFTWKD